MEAPIRLVYFEDNKALREGMSFLFQATPGFALLGAFENCKNLKETIAAWQPDVVLMDIDMPGLSGIQAVPIVKALSPATQVLMLTVVDDADAIFQAIRNGASGYLLKNTSPADILTAIRDIHRGGSPMTPSVARKVLLHFQQPKPGGEDYGLSTREMEILRGLVKGNSFKGMADELSISVETVRTHVRHIYEKLQVNSKTEAVLKALREGLTR
ncbi:response regulator transcription factor [Nibrella saemangeumensis]|uniref:Response regulator transcription factor n=1 Tax=Nibrella saemangeumensis TaxID=1084526 RepID=A0ABP8NLK2_9BACT